MFTACYIFLPCSVLQTTLTAVGILSFSRNFWYTALRKFFVPYAIEKTVATQATFAPHMRGRLEDTTAFLFSDWMYFLWHGVNEITCFFINFHAISFKSFDS